MRRNLLYLAIVLTCLVAFGPFSPTWSNSVGETRGARGAIAELCGLGNMHVQEHCDGGPKSGALQTAICRTLDMEVWTTATECFDTNTKKFEYNETCEEFHGPFENLGCVGDSTKTWVNDECTQNFVACFQGIF